MTNFEKTQLTSLGASLVGKHGMDVTFTRVETGQGIYASGEKVDGAVGLKSKVQDIPISSAARISEVLSEVKFLISNKELTQEYLLTEIGVYAMDPDDGEVLYAICFAPPEDSQVIMAFNGAFPYSAVISLKIQISAGAEVRFDTAGAVALAEDYVRQQGELDEIKSGLANLKAEDIGAFPSPSAVGSDFNAMTAPGVHMMNTNTNAPTTYRYWSLIVTKDILGGVCQIAVSRYGRDVFIRSQGGSGDWGAWQKTLMEYNVANNLVTTNAGYVLDARQGKVLKDEINGINADLSRKLTLVASDGIQGGKASVSFDADMARMYLVTFKSTGLYETHRILYVGIVSIVGESARKLYVNNIVNDCSVFNVSITNDGMTIKINSNSYSPGYERIFVWAI